MGLGGNRPLRLPMQIWDAPTRLFHWGIVLLLIVSYTSVRANATNLHVLAGYTVLSLLLFRLAWGFVGSDTARFRMFLTNPATALQYLSRFGQDEPDTQIGHNPAGGWAVLILLLLLGVEVLSGLFATGADDAAAGPLAGTVGKASSDGMAHLHALTFLILSWAIGAHLIAVAAFALIRRQDLVRPMITGKKRLPATTRAPRIVGDALAAAIFAGAVIVVALLVALA